MEEEIKKLRVRIDGLAQLTKELKHTIISVNINLKKENESYKNFINRIYNEKLGKEIVVESKEIKKAYYSLILAKAWLSKILEEFGSEISDDNETISLDKVWINETHTEKVTWLKMDIKNIIHRLTIRKGRINGIKLSLDYLDKQEHDKKLKYYNVWNALNQAYNHLTEARFWLDLEHIKNEK